MSQIIAIRKGDGNALTIIDPQMDFANAGGSLYVPGIPGESKPREVRKYVLILCHLFPFPFDYLTSSEDEHPENHIEFGIHPKHCLKGTRGQKFFPGLGSLYEQADERIIKGADPDVVAYSIVTSPNFPGHIDRLRERNIKRVFLAGWAYTHCVGSSAIAYAEERFETFVIRDATLSVPLPYGDPEKMRKMLRTAGVQEVFLSDIKFHQK